MLATRLSTPSAPSHLVDEAHAGRLLRLEVGAERARGVYVFELADHDAIPDSLFAEIHLDGVRGSAERGAELLRLLRRALAILSRREVDDVDDRLSRPIG